MPDSPFHIVLYQPVIPQNTGSIARLCACTGATLHLIHPLGFDVDEKAVRRAGLDYWPHVGVKEYASWKEFIEKEGPSSLSFFSKFAKKSLYQASFSTPHYLVFGSETKGLPEELVLDERAFKIPMRTHLVRSLNLAQAAGIVLYEAIRQTSDFESFEIAAEGVGPLNADKTAADYSGSEHRS